MPLPLIGRDLWHTGEAAPEGYARTSAPALDLLVDWSGEMNEHLLSRAGLAARCRTG